MQEIERLEETRLVLMEYNTNTVIDSTTPRSGPMTF